jgi:hypothetical protein
MVAPLASCPPWRHSIWGPSWSGSGNGWLVALLARNGKGGVEDPWVLEVFGWHVSCGGVLNDGWAEVMLSYWLQICESLSEECVAVDEARPPRRVVEISGLHWYRDGNLLLMLCWTRGSPARCVQLEDDVPWWWSSSCHLTCSGLRL